MKYVRQFDYTVMQGMDIFFSNGHKPHNYLVRFACAAAGGIKAAFRGARSHDYADHAGFITTQHGQRFATEQTPHGMREDPLDDYRGDRCRILELWRWRGWEVDGLREAGEEAMARKRRKGKEVGYDWWGAITSSWLGNKLFGRWKKPDPEDSFCSEDVIDTVLGFWLQAFGEDAPPTMPKTKNPQDVRDWVRSNPRYFSRIVDFEIPIE